MLAPATFVESEDIYRWHGDLGLLDRFTYGPSGKIPTSWQMTSVETNMFMKPAIECQGTQNLPDNRSSNSERIDQTEFTEHLSGELPRAKRYLLPQALLNLTDLEWL